MRAELLGPLNPTARRAFWPITPPQSFNVLISALMLSRSGASPYQICGFRSSPQPAFYHFDRPLQIRAGVRQTKESGLELGWRKIDAGP